MNRASQRHAERAGEYQEVKRFWTRAERHREAKVIAAKAVLSDVEKYGGEGAGVVLSARLVLRNEAERRAMR